MHVCVYQSSTLLPQAIVSPTPPSLPPHAVDRTVTSSSQSYQGRGGRSMEAYDPDQYEGGLGNFVN